MLVSIGNIFVDSEVLVWNLNITQNLRSLRNSASGQNLTSLQTSHNTQTPPEIILPPPPPPPPQKKCGSSAQNSISKQNLAFVQSLASTQNQNLLTGSQTSLIQQTRLPHQLHVQ